MTEFVEFVVPVPSFSMASANLEQSLTTLLRQSCKELRQVEPMKKKDSALILCQREYPTMIDRWRYAYPDQVASDRLLHGNVQSCILRKQGDYHKSRGRYPYEYQWIDALYVSILASCFVFFLLSFQSHH